MPEMLWMKDSMSRGWPWTLRATGAEAGWGDAVWEKLGFPVPPMAMARQTEAVFPSSSLSCTVIMNISFMFSHIRDSHAWDPDEMPRWS